MKTGDPGPGGLARQVAVVRAEPGADRAGRWTSAARTAPIVGLDLDLPLPARARELDRGRHHRDPQEHRGRARARPAEAAIGRHRELRLHRRPAGDQAHGARLPGGALQAEKLRELAEARRVRRRRLEGDLPSSGWPGHLHRRGARRAGPRRRGARDPDGGAGLRARAGARSCRTRQRAWLLQHAGSDEQQRALAAGIATGEERGTVGVRRERRARAGAGRGGGRRDRAAATRDGGRWSRPRATRDRAVDTIDPRAALARVPAAGGEALPGDDASARARPRSRARWPPSWSGVAQRAMEMAVEYAKDRKQFGRPIGAYQAVSHRCAQMLLETEGARSAVLLRGLDRRPRARVAPARGVDGEGLRVGRRLAGDARRRCRCTAGSASPGSTTCTSS